VFSARYAPSPYIKQTRFVLKELTIASEFAVDYTRYTGQCLTVVLLVPIKNEINYKISHIFRKI
jgi:hypothetical protein